MDWGCHFLRQGIFPTQGLNPRLLHLLHWHVDSLTLAPPGKPVTQGILTKYLLNEQMGRGKSVGWL